MLLLALLGTSCAGPTDTDRAGPGLNIDDPDTLDAVLDRYVEEGLLPFIYARLEDRDGKLIYEHASVNRELLPDATIDGDTWIRIWSMSKPVTISIALDLAESGVISLDDPVSRYIPEFGNLEVAVAADGETLLEVDDRSAACPVATEPLRTEMTVLQLITHEAGFYYTASGFPCLDEAFARENVATAANSEELIARLARLPLIQQPGTTDFYGTNTTVLGLVAERATGKSLNALVEEHVADGLGIEGLQYDLPSGAGLLPQFSGADGKLREAHPGELDLFGPDVPDYDSEHPLYLGGEGMLGTADGYADFLRMLLNRGELDGKRLLDEATVNEMVAPHTQLDSDWGHNGYNMWVNSGKLGDGEHGRGGLWIVGGYEGTHGWVDPELGFVGVVMTQIGKASPEANQRHDVFREAVYDQLLEERQFTDYKLYYLGGQSNMDGYGYIDELPAELRGDVDRVMIYRGMSAADNSERGGVGLWEPLRPGFGVGFRSNGYHSWKSDRFGAELTFGQRAAELNPDSKIAIVKYSRGGTPLYIDASGYGTWSPEVPGDNQYDFALRTIRESRESADIDGDGIPDRLTPAGIIWMQGEADAFDSAEAAQAYESNLRRMMDLFRAALGVDDLPVVIGQITDSGRSEDGKVMDWSDDVREAQRRYTEGDDCAALVNATNDFDYPDDDEWHYDSESYARMGVAFADAVAALEQGCEQ